MPKWSPAPIRAGKARAAEDSWRKQQLKIKRKDIDNQKSEFQNDRLAGDGLLGRALDTMYNVYNPGQRVRCDPPKIKDNTGRPLFGRFRGAK